MTIEEFRRNYKESLTPIFGSEMVMGSYGNATAKIVHIGQAPSISGMKSGMPWNDKSGQKLRDKWYLLSEEEFYNKDNFYMTAMGMYFPGKDKNGGDARPSLELARQWLPLELSLLQPKLYILIGKMAGDFFFPKQAFSDLVFYDQHIQGVTAIVLPHPSPLNIKWYKDHPQFELERLPAIRQTIHTTLGK